MLNVNTTKITIVDETRECYSSVVNIFSGPSSNDDYLGHSKNQDWLIDWLIAHSCLPAYIKETYPATLLPTYVVPDQFACWSYAQPLLTAMVLPPSAAVWHQWGTPLFPSGCCIAPPLLHRPSGLFVLWSHRHRPTSLPLVAGRMDENNYVTSPLTSLFSCRSANWH